MDSLQTVLHSESRLDTLKQITQLLVSAKERLYSEVRQSLSQEYAAVDHLRKQAQTGLQRKQTVTAEVKLRRSRYHIGKYRSENERWTCCGLTDRQALGCTELLK